MVCELHLNKTAKKKSIGHGALLCSSGSSRPVTQVLTSLFTHALNTVLAHTKHKGSGGWVRWLNLPSKNPKEFCD